MKAKSDVSNLFANNTVDNITIFFKSYDSVSISSAKYIKANWVKLEFNKGQNLHSVGENLDFTALF